MAASKKNNYIDTATALSIVERYGKRISKPTLIKWVKSNNLGHQCITGSYWFIDKIKLIKLLEKGKI